MKFKLFKSNLSIIQKICLSGLFLALVIILQKVIAINYLSFAPFIRVSLGGPALIIFSSILLGPIYGMLIGAGSDILGYFVFDIKSFPYYPQVTAIYALLGFASYFIFSLIYSIKNQKILSVVEIVFLSLIWIAVSLYVILSKEIQLFSSPYQISTLTKILVPSILALIFVGIILFSFLYKTREENPIMSPMQICFASFICDIFIIVIFGSIMKAWAFGFATFLAIILCQAMVMFINVMLDTLFICVFQKITKKYFVL